MSASKTVLLTGASSGIGLELSRLFAQDNHDLVLVARNEEKLNGLAEELKQKYNVNVIVMPKDLSNPASPDEIFEELKARDIIVDILVNNAGFATSGVFHVAGEDEQMGILQVNVHALTKLTHLFLPTMVAQNSGKIMNIASIAAFLPGPKMAVYYASKAFVLSFSEALAEELSGTGVTVTAVCPGPTDTAFDKRAGLDDKPLFNSPAVMSAAKVAMIGYRALMNGKKVVVTGFRNKIQVFSLRFIPRSWAAKIAKRLQ